MSSRPKPVVLIILDGWGHREDPHQNAIAVACKPAWDRLWSKYPHTLINASEHAVGLPASQMGNSEVGHLNLGAGRVVHQEYTRIDNAISTGAFFKNAALIDAVDLAARTGKAVHILGLLSPGGVHSHEDQIHAVAALATQRGAEKLYLHAFLDGRDTPPQSALAALKAMDAKFAQLGHGRVASIVGRYYAMDRDSRWDRVQAAYDLITQGRAAFTAADAPAGLQLAYDRGETDEFVKATAIVPSGADAPVRMEHGDVVIFMNFRADRARQMTRALIENNFSEFPRAVTPKLGRLVCLTQYNADFAVPVAFPPVPLNNVMGAYLASAGLRQLRVAETEKYAHVTFFFNGGVETPFAGEDRVLVPSPTEVATYDQKPEMSAPRVADEIVQAIKNGSHDVIIANFANADMVGHTGDFDATVRAIETIDACLGRILEALLEVGGEMLITSDHGNAEQLFDVATGQAHTAHTTNPVPLIYVGRPADLAATGALEDIAPTMLQLLDLPIPPEMSGRSLVALRRDRPSTNTAPTAGESAASRRR